MTGSTVMVLAALAAAGLIWVIATEPLFVAALAATGDALDVLIGIGARAIAAIW